MLIIIISLYFIYFKHIDTLEIDDGSEYMTYDNYLENNFDEI